jgi:hypothetical protein
MDTPHTRLPDFDREKPFFPLVMNFASQMIGFKEIATMADVLIIRNMMNKVLPASHFETDRFQLIVSPAVSLDGFDLAYPYKEEFRQMFVQTPNLPLERLLTHTAPFEIVGSRALKCRTQEAGILFSAEEIAAVYLTNAEKQTKASGVSAGRLIVSAFESVKYLKDQSPVWEFFRHCRNAAAHGGRFNLHPDEPFRPAAWKALRIHNGLHGTPLFDIVGDPGLLALGDAILSLWDIEQLCP